MYRILPAVFVGLAFIIGLTVLDPEDRARTGTAQAEGREFSLAEYAGMLLGPSGRSADATAYERETQRQALLAEGTRAQLPSAPRGWTRRNWRPDDGPSLDPGTFYGPEAQARRQNHLEFHVYEGAGQTMAIRARYHTWRGADLPDWTSSRRPTAASAEADEARPPAFVIQGVPFTRMADSAGDAAGKEDRSAGDPTHALQVYEGSIGQEVLITVRARASEAEVYRLLQGVDYDALNGMLVARRPDVGAHVQTVPLIEQLQHRDTRQNAQSVAAAAPGRLADRPDHGRDRRPDAAPRRPAGDGAQVAPKRRGIPFDGTHAEDRSGAAVPTATKTDFSADQLRVPGTGRVLRVSGSGGGDACVASGGTLPCRKGAD